MSIGNIAAGSAVRAAHAFEPGANIISDVSNCPRSTARAVPAAKINAPSRSNDVRKRIVSLRAPIVCRLRRRLVGIQLRAKLLSHRNIVCGQELLSNRPIATIIEKR
jgi:hypothetical protein